jgi:hypothetical protein
MSPGVGLLVSIPKCASSNAPAGNVAFYTNVMIFDPPKEVIKLGAAFKDVEVFAFKSKLRIPDINLNPNPILTKM